jgi:plasmid maintenance system antidote protein VapI
LARLLNTSPDLWLNMQRAVDLWDESHRLSEELASIEPIAA